MYFIILLLLLFILTFTNLQQNITNNWFLKTKTDTEKHTCNVTSWTITSGGWNYIKKRRVAKILFWRLDHFLCCPRGNQQTENKAADSLITVRKMFFLLQNCAHVHTFDCFHFLRQKLLNTEHSQQYVFSISHCQSCFYRINDTKVSSTISFNNAETVGTVMSYRFKAENTYF